MASTPHQLCVVICTHNPRPAYLGRVLEGLQHQTLDPQSWDFIIVDNLSNPPLSERCDISWHPHGRIVIEKELGLTPARLRGFREASPDVAVVVYVDDDNVLAPDYLQHVLEIEKDHPLLGAWGGSAFGEYETPPAPWMLRHVGSLAIREIAHDQWTNHPATWGELPVGAGMCVRRKVLAHYAHVLATDSRRRSLDRRGTSLSSGGDTDLALTAIDVGLGVGNFARLKLQHLMPSGRLTFDYLRKLSENLAYSGNVLLYLRDKPPRPLHRYLPIRLGFWFLDFYRHPHPQSRALARSSRKGRLRAMREFVNLRS